jgi:heme exporter protein D
MITYAALAVLAASTLSDHRIRGVTLAVLAMFAVKTWVRRKDVLHPDSDTPRDADRFVGFERARLYSRAVKANTILRRGWKPCPFKACADVAQLVEHSLGKLRRLRDV